MAPKSLRVPIVSRTSRSITYVLVKFSRLKTACQHHWRKLSCTTTYRTICHASSWKTATVYYQIFERIKFLPHVVALSSAGSRSASYFLHWHLLHLRSFVTLMRSCRTRHICFWRQEQHRNNYAYYEAATWYPRLNWKAAVKLLAYEGFPQCIALE